MEENLDEEDQQRAREMAIELSMSSIADISRLLSFNLDSVQITEDDLKEDSDFIKELEGINDPSTIKPLKKVKEPALLKDEDVFKEIQEFDLSSISFETKKPVTTSKSQTTSNVAQKPATTTQPSQSTPVRVQKVLQPTTKAPVSSKSQIKTSTTPVTTKPVQATKPSPQVVKQNPTPQTTAKPQTSTTSKSTQVDAAETATQSQDTQAKTGEQRVLDRGKVLIFLETHLKKQITSAIEKAQKFKSNGDMEKAKEQLYLKRGWEKDIAAINEIKDQPDIPCPQYSIVKKEIKKEILNNDLSPHILEISILQYKHIKPPQGYTSLSMYACVEVPFPEEKPQNFTSSTVVCNFPNFTSEWKTFVQIERKKPLATFILKKKITLSLYHYRYLFSDILVGTVEVKPNLLSEKSTVILDCDILENKKPTGGKVTVQLRLQFPVIQREYDIKVEKLLNITKHFTLADVLEQDEMMRKSLVNTKQPVPKQIQTPKEQTKQPQQTGTKQEIQKQVQKEIKNEESITPKQNKETVEEKLEEIHQNQKELNQGTPEETPEDTPTEAPEEKPEEATAETPKELPDTENLNWVVSERVLQHELSEISQMIKQRLQKKQDIMELSAQKMAIETRINIIIGLIQQGELTVEKYAEMIQTKIADEKYCEEIYRSQGNKKCADRCLLRIKLMEEELSG